MHVVRPYVGPTCFLVVHASTGRLAEPSVYLASGFRADGRRFKTRPRLKDCSRAPLAKELKCCRYSAENHLLGLNAVFEFDDEV